MHYINIIDYAYPDDLFMFLSARVNSSNIQRNNGWTLCKVNDKELTVKNLSGYISEYIWEIVLPKKCMFLLNKCEKITYEIRRDILVRTLNVASYMKSISADLVQNELSEYLKDGNSYLSVDGFFVFRLKGLNLKIDQLILGAIILEHHRSAVFIGNAGCFGKILICIRNGHNLLCINSHHYSPQLYPITTIAIFQPIHAAF